MIDALSPKAVIYARFSCENQREESIEGQIRECTEYAEKSGYMIVGNYIDRAFSAKTDNRPDFQRMIKDSNKQLFDVVIVWKLDRFSRDRYDSAKYKTILKKNGIKVESAMERISDGADGILIESVLEGYAEYFSADLSEKVSRGMTENVLNGKFNGGPVPMGYVIDKEKHFQIDPVVSPLILAAFKKYSGGATMTEVQHFLNDSGVTNGRGKPVEYGSVERMLKNRRYIGEYSFQGTVIPDAIPAIIPQKLFDKVQSRMEQNRKAPARYKAKEEYLLTTKLFCGYCGAHMCGESGKGRHGTVHHYYKCANTKKKKTCHKRSVRKQWLEDLVIDNTVDMIMDDNRVKAIVSQVMDMQERENLTLPVLEKRLNETNRGIENMLNAIQAGVLTESTKARLEELEHTRKELETDIAVEKLAKPKLTEEQVRHWILTFRMLDMTKPEHRKKLVDTFVNAIYLYDDKITITYNYKEDSKTILLEDVNNAKSGSGSHLNGVPSCVYKIDTANKIVP